MHFLCAGDALRRRLDSVRGKDAVMFGFGGKRRKAGEGPLQGRRAYEVGWLFTDETGSVIWDDPAPLRPETAETGSSKSVAHCPAVVDFDRRHFVITCPVDIHMRLSPTSDGKLNVTNVAGAMGSVRQATLNRMFVFMPQHEWRNPQRPVVQMTTPYLFVSDDPVTINQFPPFLHHLKHPRPGIQLCGRFPIDIWPRPLMWAFEWHDLSQDLILKRGDPWFYVRFETPDPARPVRLIEAEMTEDLRRHAAAILDVSNYVNRTFSLFPRARARRPKRLLTPKRRN